MIRIICREETYVYNAYHIGKAFYPSEEVQASVEEKASHYVTLYLPSGQVLELDEEEGKDRKRRKHLLDQKLYHTLSAETRRELSWGILTGVRPTKIAMGKLEEGMDREAFLAWFAREYLVSGPKARLSWEIVEKEKSLLDRLDYQEGYSLYVGIPFCPSVCAYCSFSSGSLSQWGDHVEPYLEALHRELEFIGSASDGKKLNTIYFGGGTPTSLNEDQLERLLSWIDEIFPRDHLLEYTVEAGRPDSITREKLAVIQRHGVTRISINPQSMQQKTLDRIGRRHRVEEIISAFQMAREEGFDNINMDVIAGLPGERLADMEDTLAKLEALGPDSLTVHSLAVKRSAKMGQDGYVPGRESQDAGPEEISAMLEAAAKSAGRMGMTPYYLYRQKNIAGNFENTGYAKVDKAGIYNILIMEEKQSIIAAGAGASTKLVFKEPVVNPEGKKQKKTNLIGLENVKAIDAYIRRGREMIERKGEWLWR